MALNTSKCNYLTPLYFKGLSVTGQNITLFGGIKLHVILKEFFQ